MPFIGKETQTAKIERTIKFKNMDIDFQLRREIISRGRACAKRFGEDLLSRRLSDSIMGAERFHGRVRDGFVCVTLAIPTKSHRTEFVLLLLILCLFREITTSHTIFLC